MEELIELNKKQLRMQKIIALLLALLLLALAAGGMAAAKEIREVSAELTAAMERFGQIDVEGINETLSGTQEMMQSMNEFTDAIDSVTERVRDLGDWMDGMFGR